jgi:tRNA modification GTPase
VLELSCHGGIAVLRSVLSAVLSAGARLADPGEFTKRAFLNGKLDLAQAEAVNDLIRATADGARKAALRQLGGGLSEQVGQMRGRLLGLLASIEAAIDFPEDVPEPEMQHVRAEVEAVRDEIGRLRLSFKTGRIYREGLRVVIAGRVNVGKSSLLNALLRYARAIVTPIPGTTRDVIEESLQIDGIPVVAIDTAGIRQTDDPVERIGVELTEQTLESADIILVVIDASEGVKQADEELLNRIGGRRAIMALNKIDLLSEKARGLMTKEWRHTPLGDRKCSAFSNEYVGTLGRSFPAVQTCAFSGQGIDELEEEIARQAGGASSESALVTNARHEGLLESAGDGLGRVVRAIESGDPIDLVSIDLTAAAGFLGQITGETATEDLIDRIFSEFCIGK